ncbi:MAG TPA: hypothetical protein DDX81_03185 [Desulfofustis sp.]|nr:hypothetical protein [Desulfofustis sp.]
MCTINRYVLLFFCGIMVSGCAFQGNYGALRETNEVTTLFQNKEILQGYNYFYSGDVARPRAILAVKEQYSLAGEAWESIEISESLMETWAASTQLRPAYETGSTRYGGRYQGANIFDPRGELAAVWYSRYDWGLFEFRDDNVIFAFPPKNRPGSDWNKNKRDR